MALIPVADVGGKPHFVSPHQVARLSVTDEGYDLILTVGEPLKVSKAVGDHLYNEMKGGASGSRVGGFARK